MNILLPWAIIMSSTSFQSEETTFPWLWWDETKALWKFNQFNWDVINKEESECLLPSINSESGTSRRRFSASLNSNVVNAIEKLELERWHGFLLTDFQEVIIYGNSRFEIDKKVRGKAANSVIETVPRRRFYVNLDDPRKILGLCFHLPNTI